MPLVNVTFSLPDETVRRLRDAARRTGQKGAISEMVDAALREHLKEVESREARQEFRAQRGERVVARAGSLRALSAILEQRGVDPREVLILSSSPLPPSVKTGLRRRFE